MPIPKTRGILQNKNGLPKPATRNSQIMKLIANQPIRDILRTKNVLISVDEGSTGSSIGNLLAILKDATQLIIPKMLGMHEIRIYKITIVQFNAAGAVETG